MQNPGATWEGLLNTSNCACGSVVEIGHEFCFHCGQSLGTALDPSFDGDDGPTQLQAPEFAREAAKLDVWTRSVAPVIPAPPPSAGFRKGLLLGAGLSTLAFGSVALVGIGFALGTRSVAGTSAASIADARPLADAKPVVVEAKPVVVEAKPIAIAAVDPKPVPVVVEAKPLVVEAKPLVVEAKPIAIAAVDPKPVPVVIEAKPVVAEAKPVVREVKPVAVAKPAIAVKPVAATRTIAPKPTAAPVVVARPSPVVAEKSAPARPNRDELAALAASVRQKVAAPAPAKPAEKATVAAYNWDDQPTAAPAPAASWAPVELETEVLDAPKTAAPAVDPDLDDILGAPAASAKSPSPSAKAPARASTRSTSARIIHAQKGDVTIALNASIALTRTNGKPLVGKLIDVDGGFVAVKTADAHVKIAESDVIEAATY